MCVSLLLRMAYVSKITVPRCSRMRSGWMLLIRGRWLFRLSHPLQQNGKLQQNLLLRVFQFQVFGRYVNNKFRLQSLKIECSLNCVWFQLVSLSWRCRLFCNRELWIYRRFPWYCSHLLGEGVSPIARLMGFLLGCDRPLGGSSARKVETISTLRPLSGKQRLRITPGSKAISLSI